LCIQLPGQGIHKVARLQGIGGMPCGNRHVDWNGMGDSWFPGAANSRMLIDKVVLNTGQTLGM
jgi:hypothetical protein